MALVVLSQEQREHEALVVEVVERNQVLRWERQAVQVKFITDL